MSLLSFKHSDDLYGESINKNTLLKIKIKTKTCYCYNSYIIFMYSTSMNPYPTLKNREEKYYRPHFTYGNTEAQRK